MRKNRFRWFVMDVVRVAIEINVESTRGRGRSKKR